MRNLTINKEKIKGRIPIWNAGDRLHFFYRAIHS